MPDSKQPDDVATYAAAVRAALAQLPDTERTALLEDLENHLEEVASESDTPLLERLGKPEDYAAELRLAYGAGGGGGSGSRLRHRLRALIAAVASTRAYREIRTLLPELRPGWWVLRAYLAILILAFFLRDGHNLRPMPNPFSTFGLLETVAMLAAMYASVRIGRRGVPSAIGWRGAAAAGNVAIALLALPVLVEMQTVHSYTFPAVDSQYFPSVEAGYYGSGFTNVYPYTKDGKPLKDILLYDQNGKPLTIPIKDPNVLTEFPVGADGRPITNEFPLSQRHPNGDPILPPRVALPPSPTNAPSPSPAAPTPAAGP